MFCGPTRVCLRHAFRRVVTTAPAKTQDTGTRSSEPPFSVQDFSFSPLAWRPAEDELLIRNSFACLPTCVSASSLSPLPFYAATSSQAEAHNAGESIPYVAGHSGSGAVLSVGRGLPGSAWLSHRVLYSHALARKSLATRWCDCTSTETKERFACAHGAYASFLLVNVASTALVPASVSDEEAAIVGSHGLLAHYLVRDSYPVGPGSIVVVHAAAGGTGLLVCQMAKLCGAEMVIGICGGADKVEVAKRVGKADHVIDYKAEPHWPAAVLKLLPPGRVGVDAVFAEDDDSHSSEWPCAVRKADVMALVPSLRPGAVVLHSVNPLPSVAMPRDDVCVRASLGDAVEAYGPEAARDCLASLLARVAEKELVMGLGTTWPLRKIGKAYETIATGDVVGVPLLNCVD